MKSDLGKIWIFEGKSDLQVHQIQTKFHRLFQRYSGGRITFQTSLVISMYHPLFTYQIVGRMPDIRLPGLTSSSWPNKMLQRYASCYIEKRKNQ